MGSEKLEPCPMCGGPAVNVGFEYITCGVPSRCDAHSWLYSDTEMEWNEMSKALRARVSELEQKLAAVEAERDSQRDPTSMYESGYKRGFELGKRLSWERFMPKIDSALAEAEDERIECSRRAERAEARVVEIEAERAETEAKLAAVERRNGELADTIYNQHVNYCNESWTGRGLHAPECDIEDLTPAELAAAEARRQQPTPLPSGKKE